MTDPHGKVAVITGAANGLGRAMAIELYSKGYHLALIDIDDTGLLQLKAELSSGQNLSIHKADVSQEAEIIDCKNAIMDVHKQVDIFINNAAVSISQPFEQLNTEDHKRLFDINFWGAVYCTKHFLPELKKQNKSHLVSIISQFAFIGFPGKTSYASSKGALMAFTNSLKTELGDTGVKVSIAIPPPMPTQIVTKGKHTDEIKRQKEIEFLQARGMDAGKAAKIIIRNMQKGNYRIVVGPMMFWVDLLSRLSPKTAHWFIAKNKKKFGFV